MGSQELHNATLAAGLAVPARPSWLHYFTSLHAQFGDSKAGFLPQNLQSHKRGVLRGVLGALFARHKGKPDPNFTAKLTSANKRELVQRLAARLSEVMEAGRVVEASQLDSDED